jgi:hypothetical protein
MILILCPIKMLFLIFVSEGVYETLKIGSKKVKSNIFFVSEGVYETLKIG